jgi:predicted dithiol-disulfide oxidoreductase (DUF899 family)
MTPDHSVGTREEYEAARDELLKKEKELTRRNDELTEERRALPWLEIDKEYRFQTEHGERSLADLFDGRSQLVVYHFMFGPAYEAGCPVCSSSADSFDGAVAHLNARDTTFTAISRAPLDKLVAYRDRMGWSFPWASSEGSDFNFDFGASHTEEQIKSFLDSGPSPVMEKIAEQCGTDAAGFIAEGPALTVFARENGTVYQTYATGTRGLEFMMGYYGYLDRVPKGRDETDSTDHWIRRHDEY